MIIYFGKLKLGDFILNGFAVKLKEFFKKEIVLVIAFFLAVISAFFVKPSLGYIDYIDFRVLGILLGLMIIMSAFQRTGVFDKIGIALLKLTKNTRQLYAVLIFLCFFTSMFITNDVALITFVPFAILTLKKAQKEDKLIFVIVMQTIGANLGSMLTPMGNPQNLYLYNLSQMSLGEFILFLIPYTLLSLVGIIISVFLCKNEAIDTTAILTEENEEFSEKTTIQTVTYSILFLLGILTVCRVVPCFIMLAIVVLAVLISDRKAFKSVDYCLIFTFICFFVFIGNMKNIEFINSFLQTAVNGNEIIVGVLSSQAISNVPAALMLSGFTSDYNSLLIGVNIGGLGTLIASMASLISYKLFAHDYNNLKGKYLLYFTLVNIAFLIPLLIMAFILN